MKQRPASRTMGGLTLRIIRTEEVTKKTGLSRTTLWRRERAGHFPPRRDLGGGMVGWLEADVDEWLESRPYKTEEPQERVQEQA